MNYTLKQLQEWVNKLVEQQGGDAYCGAWIYTKEDIHPRGENGDVDWDLSEDNPDIIEQTYNLVGNSDYIYQVIQETVDEMYEEARIQYQVELV